MTQQKVRELLLIAIYFLSLLTMHITTNVNLYDFAFLINILSVGGLILNGKQSE